MAKRTTKTQTAAATHIAVEPKRPLTPAEEQLAQALAHIARRAHLCIVRRNARPDEASQP